MNRLKTGFTVSILTLSFSALALFGIGEDEKEPTAEVVKTAEECEIPAFAKAIGHEDQWLLHNGCPPREDKDAKKEDSK